MPQPKLFAVRGRKITIFKGPLPEGAKHRIYERCDKSGLMIRVGNVNYDLATGRSAYF
jgi:hypothetical protein